jgi:hypothetical protein
MSSNHQIFTDIQVIHVLCHFWPADVLHQRFRGWRWMSSKREVDDHSNESSLDGVGVIVKWNWKGLSVHAEDVHRVVEHCRAGELHETEALLLENSIIFPPKLLETSITHLRVAEGT